MPQSSRLIDKLLVRRKKVVKRQSKRCRRSDHRYRRFERLESRQLLAFNVVDSVVDMSGPQIEFDLSGDVDPASLQAGDLLVDAVPALSVILTDADTVVFTLPPLSAGPHIAAIASGAITDTSQVGIDAFNGSFTVGATAE